MTKRWERKGKELRMVGGLIWESSTTFTRWVLTSQMERAAASHYSEQGWVTLCLEHWYITLCAVIKHFVLQNLLKKKNLHDDRKAEIDSDSWECYVGPSTIPAAGYPWQTQHMDGFLTCCSLVPQIPLGIMSAKPSHPHLAPTSLGNRFL